MTFLGYPTSSAVKNLPAVQETQEMQETQVWYLGQKDHLEGKKGNPLQYSCWENPMDRGFWRSVHGVAESDTTEHGLPHAYLPPKVSQQKTQFHCALWMQRQQKRKRWFLLTIAIVFLLFRSFTWFIFKSP